MSDHRELYAPQVGDRVRVSAEHPYGPAEGTVTSLHLGIHVRLDYPTWSILCFRKHVEPVHNVQGPPS